MKITPSVTEIVNKSGYNAVVVSNNSRTLLATHFPPKYSDWIGHHVTVEFGVPKSPTLLYGKLVDLAVVGYVEDEGIEVLVVSVDGYIHRPDGKIYHITWSLDRLLGRKPVHSGAVIANSGYQPILPIQISGTLEHLR